MTVAFIVFAVLTVISALGVVFAAKPLTSALCLVATLFLVAVHFAMLGADLIAALQIVIYAGAIMILVVFVIMLLGLEQRPVRSSSYTFKALAAVSSLVFLAILGFAFSGDVIASLENVSVRGEGQGYPREIGLVLMTEYVYAFQLSALLLLAAIIGAVLLAYERKRPLTPGRGLKAVQRSAD